MRKIAEWRLEAARHPRPHRPAEPRARPLRAATGIARDDLGTAGRAWMAARGCRSIPTACRSSSIRPRAGHARPVARRTSRCPTSLAGRAPVPAGQPPAQQTGLSVSPLTFAIAVGALGLFVGSFLNVCIYRLPLGRTVLWGRSHCPHCERQIRAWENLPVISWLALRGRCAGCGAPISVQYPLVELATGVIFAAGAWLYGPTLLLVARLVLACAMVVLFMIDLQHRILPNVITLPGIVVGLAFSLVLPPGFATRSSAPSPAACSCSRMGEVVSRALGQGGAGLRRRQDDRDDGRVSRLAADARRAVSRVLRRQRHRPRARGHHPRIATTRSRSGPSSRSAPSPPPPSANRCSIGTSGACSFSSPP